MRPLVLLLVLLPLAIGAIAAFAWMRAGTDRYAALEEEGLALARVLRGAALEAVETQHSAEQNLVQRLAAVARRADHVIARTRAPAAQLLQSIAEEEQVGRIFFFDKSAQPIALGRYPAAIAGTGSELLRPKRKAELQWRDASAALAAGAPAAREVRVEGLRPNLFGTRERFGIFYGRVDGGTLLLRAGARELSELRRRFGLDPLLERVVELPSVDSVRVWGSEGDVRLARGPAPGGEPEAAPDPARVGSEGRVALDGAHLRALLPVATPAESVVIDLRLSRARADRAVSSSRRTILLGALLAMALALGAGVVLLVREAAVRRARSEAAARLEEERRLAEMGALAGLVTHEVSNPLNSVRLALGVLEDQSGGSDGQAGIIATMKEEVARMGRTLEGYMALASSDRRVRRRVDPDLAQQVRARVAAEARERGVQVTVEVSDDAPAVLGDAVVLEQAIANLVRNAVQASPRNATVHLSWKRAADGDALLTVGDEGAGFPEDRSALLRLGGAHRGGGHGLGLPLAKRFIESHGGRMVLSDREGGGAEVRVTLPAAREEHGSDE